MICFINGYKWYCIKKESVIQHFRVQKVKLVSFAHW